MEMQSNSTNVVIEKKWYMITVVSGKEDKVIESLRNRMISENMQDFFSEFKVMMIPHLSPREIQKKLKGEPYKARQKNLFPGYIFVKMEMSNEAWFMVRNTQYVTGLVGSSGQRTKPTPVSEDEMLKLKAKVEKIISDFEHGKVNSPFSIGAIVEIVDGPTKGQIGKIIEKNDNLNMALVEIVLFERKTPIEIPYQHLKIKK